MDSRTLRRLCGAGAAYEFFDRHHTRGLRVGDVKVVATNLVAPKSAITGCWIDPVPRT
jgi:hypothetical protein